MRVKSIVIDGFKSYAHRKALEDLSPHFNAITGLNGSGKSNIFDAVCFVMGITNLKRVRAEDPRELIFRAGTTGVHAARVTIEFINDDPRTAPPGYSCEEYPIITVGRQIKLGGKQQFFLNNTVSMQSKVKRFFESISLNVDNPHFMVLQGTVHKLIGMRSQDILSLIEEAVGTKAFDHRRRTAENLIRSKEKKMEEIDNNIETQIGPMLLAMKADQDEYERFVQMSEGIEEKRRFRVAFEYDEQLKQLEQRRERRAALERDIASSKEQLQFLPASEDTATRRLMELQQALAAPAEAFISLHEEEASLKKQLARDEAQVEGAEKALHLLKDNFRKLEKEKEKQQGRMEKFASKKQQRDVLVERLCIEKENVAKLKRSLQLQISGVRAGMSGMSLEEERADIERQMIHYGAAARRCDERVKELERQLQHFVQKTAARSETIAKLETELARAHVRLDAEAGSYAAVAPLESRRRALQEELVQLKAEHWKANDALQREMGNGGRGFDVDYDRRACPDLDQHIYGRVAELIGPREEKYAMALMVGAQTQLLRVVVTNDLVAEKIIRHGLRQRTAFLPLNTLQRSKGVDGSRMEEAKRIAARMGGFLAIAKDLIEVKDESYRIVVEHVYGQFFVCSSLALAQELAYNPAVRCKAVTLNGDLVEPNGLMTGGSTQHLRDIFAEVRVYHQRKAPVKELQMKIARVEAELEDVQEQLRQQAPLIRRYKEAEEAVGLAEHKLQLERGDNNGPVEELGAALDEERRKHEVEVAALRELKERKAALEQHTREDPDKARKELHEQLTAAQERCSALAREEEAGSAEFDRMEADITQLAADLERKMADVQEEMSHRTAARDEAKVQLCETGGKLQNVVEHLRQLEEQRTRLEKEVEEVQEELQQLMVKKSSLEAVIKNAEVDLRDAAKATEELQKSVHEAERRHAWLVEERHTFGRSEGPYYFDDKARTTATLQELREAESQAAVMSKRLNRKATILYEERKREYNELVLQRSALGEDRDAIQQCILGIEGKKWHALDRMVKVVSSVFSKLFSNCLPGAAAVLREERDDRQHLCGLQVKVMFNGKEKESLSELSGGQRSLLALCLILAILRVRQAPVYILDEVDAALDPSHTQNIGCMLQTHFPSSQFLLVSLKDGMFNNADVLYQVSNTQGYSEITRLESGAGHA
ncbi:putative structural maintenance of chromosome (SMC) [Trypanosoma rangeli]|uniref:Structural maintenance of chromosomes protein n=1 Tax=Trypanosoma rangeli TaxID=5698 RepID=A0A3R7M449_TRYRA|nr:putative structural maintenance of chromosome (SMC) [Trypanosoma rangeli]RNE99047.1 putative structural maintenance of chromosome (SMC) [Trypanosoma rangeli]|eukprot:RNE99047.1 putative structural maintenance of chromosome (SMC) [Trypanosoma rangeli]